MSAAPVVPPQPAVCCPGEEQREESCIQRHRVCSHGISGHPQTPARPPIPGSEPSAR